jgi:hypothetical protein
MSKTTDDESHISSIMMLTIFYVDSDKSFVRANHRIYL